ncbi:FAD-dependent oxidoreductase [Micromonospora sediminimaris]|nr:FAD-dependent oxidoreductase [Micromonospora sediminimaris]SFC03849.1 FAD dependent oxidoreductase [Micromonospora sediminimaris]
MNQFVTDVVVAGSGLLGLATAFELLSRDLDVTVVGPRTGDHAGQASRAAGAMLTVFSEVEANHDPQRVSLEVGERLVARTGLRPGWTASARPANRRYGLSRAYG